jgi:alpha-tubulin suppressor-like RCC1 family protein
MWYRAKDFATIVAFVLTSSALWAQPTSTPIITWGSNINGQLGRSNPSVNLNPGPVAGINQASGAVAVAAGSTHSLALKSDGSVLAWGSNANGQLGDGTTVSKLAPIQVSGLGAGSGVVSIAAGASFSLALKSDGTVLAWGLNSNGQLGDGTTVQRTTPVQVSNLGSGSGVVSVAAGFGAHGLALKSDGTVLGWGQNSSGQLGDGTTSQKTIPVPVSGLGVSSGVVAIAVGSSFSFARKSDGSVLAWGANSNGQLGDGTTTAKNTPVPVSGFEAGSGVVAIAAGLTHSLAVKSDGTVWSWGFNGSGQLGDGTFTQRMIPGPVSDPSGTGFLTGAAAVAAGSIYSLAIKADGAMLAWGNNTSGELGDGSVTLRVTPVPVSGLAAGSGVIAAAGGNSHSFALKQDGALLAWGANNAGQLGKGTFDGQAQPIEGLADIDAIAAGIGGSHSLAHKSDGTVLAWGLNLNGQLGDGTTSSKMAPVQVSGLGIGSGVVAVAAGNAHSLALKADGTVLAWGSNTNGQLGDGTTSQKTTPVQVMGLGVNSGIMAIAAGNSFSVALGSDGSVWTWGQNTNGQLGDATLAQRTSPVRVTGFGAGSGVVAIAAGNTHVIAVKSDGTAWAWGLNTNGQLGDGTFSQRTTPVQVRDVTGVGFLTGIASVAAGASFTVARGSDGTVLAWGLNNAGQLGDGSLIQRNTPAPVNMPVAEGFSFVKISAGASHALALTSTGAVWVWGSNANGQLGDGTLENRSVPVPSVVNGAGAIAGGSAHSLALAAPPRPTDHTQPMISATLTGTLGNNGWYTSDVTVSWTVEDPESSFSATSCSPVTLSTETPGTTLTCTAINSAGLMSAASATVKIDKTGPSVSFTRSAANANGWNNGAVAVRFSALDTQSGLDGGAFIDREVSGEGQNQSVTAMFADLAGNTVSATVEGINIDKTAPTVQFGAAIPAANAAGWNNSDVEIGFSAADNLSGVVSSSAPSPLVLTNEGAHVTGGVTVSDAAGNSATVASPAVRIDKTAPVASAVATPLPDADGWNKTDVTVKFEANDSLSGIAGCSEPIILSGNGRDQSASGACTDNAGNMSLPATRSGINIDKTPPTITGMPVENCMIWPPDKRMVQIAAVKVVDADGGVAAGSLSLSVTSSEPEDPSDIVVSDGIVHVRADKRTMTGIRVYTVVAKATDLAGNAVVATGTCSVPHDTSLQ